MTMACKMFVASILGGLLLALGLVEASQHPLLPSHNNLLKSLQQEDFVTSELFGFNVDWDHYGDHLTINENITSELFPAGITGSVKLVPGDQNQDYSFLVLVQASSPSQEALDLISMSNSTHSVYVSSFSTGPSPAAVAIDIIIFVATHVLQFGTTNVWVKNLDIEVWPDLDFETYHMDLATIHGKITGNVFLWFTAHNIRISSEYGSIVGSWSFPSTISFSTNTGDIDIDLIPKRWSSGPQTKGDISALSRDGDIAIRMPLATEFLDLRNGTAVILAPGGSITGTFMHGVYTALKAYGSIDATLLPHSAFPEWGGIVRNYIITDARHGNTTVTVLPPVINSYYKTNPLFFAISSHTQGTPDTPRGPPAKMEVSYPGQWGGVAVGHSGFGGRIKVSGDDFEVVGKNASTVMVQRRPLGSDLWFEADTGFIELHLDPCFSVDCGFP